MSNSIRSILFIFIMLAIAFVLVFIFSEDPEEYCNALVKRASNSTIQTNLEQWVHDNVSEKKIAALDVLVGGGMWPGRYMLLNKPYDWNLLGFQPDSQIRLIVVPEVVGDVESDIEHIKSVFFGERTRFGLLVKTRESHDFGVDNKHIIVVTPTIAAVCMLNK